MKSFALALLSTFTALLGAGIAESQAHEAHESEIIGRWYMGTATGRDCNLELQRNHILRLQEGGCFHQDPAIRTSWKLEGQKITIENPSVKQRLGTYLLIAYYRNNIVLVPEKERDEVNKHGYIHYFCFWRNLIDNGLKLPSDAAALREKYLKQPQTKTQSM